MTRSGTVTVTPNLEIDVTPKHLRRYAMQIVYTSPDYKKETDSKALDGTGFTVDLEQTEEGLGVMSSNPKALVRGTVYSSGHSVEIGGDNAIDVRDLEAFARGILTVVAEARKAGLFPAAAALTPKGRAALRKRRRR